jgi:hypothetical protein
MFERAVPPDQASRRGDGGALLLFLSQAVLHAHQQWPGAGSAQLRARDPAPAPQPRKTPTLRDALAAAFPSFAGGSQPSDLELARFARAHNEAPDCPAKVTTKRVRRVLDRWQKDLAAQVSDSAPRWFALAAVVVSRRLRDNISRQPA